MEKLFNGDKVYMIPPTNKFNAQSMAYVIILGEKVVVIDGGWQDDYLFLQNFLLDNGYDSIDLWILTHAHPDHIGAVSEILEDNLVKIKEICFDFPDEIDYESSRVDENVLKLLYKEIKDKNIKYTKPKLGDIDFDGIRLHFIKLGYTDSIDFNNTSIVFKLYTKGEPILFLGDIHNPECDKLCSEKPDELKCNVCQMAHHGQNKAPISFYKCIGLKYALFNTPVWLWNNDTGEGFDTGPFWTINTRKQLQELNAECIVCFDKIIKLE